MSSQRIQLILSYTYCFPIFHVVKFLRNKTVLNSLQKNQVNVNVEMSAIVTWDGKWEQNLIVSWFN